VTLQQFDQLGVGAVFYKGRIPPFECGAYFNACFARLVVLVLLCAVRCGARSSSVIVSRLRAAVFLRAFSVRAY
jgi:hypothetical protein